MSTSPPPRSGRPTPATASRTPPCTYTAGSGVDLDHPVHRYFLAAKQTEFAVGGATGQLLRIGRELADTPA